MLARASDMWESLRASYWFLPTLMSLLAILLSVLTIHLDRTTELDGDPLWGIIYSGGPEGSRSVLEVIAGSMITVTGIVFSMTIVALSLASSQLGPRVLRAFIRDRGNQVVLGTFISTFIYCLMVLRTIHSQEAAFVPNISVTIGIALSLLSLGVLIYFIHHIAKSIQADQMVAAVAGDLKRSIRAVLESAEKATEDPNLDESRSGEIRATREGYLRTLDHGQLLKLAAARDLVIRVGTQAGDFVTRDQVIARVWGKAGRSQEIQDDVRKAWVLGPTRTQTQDMFFLVDQLVQIALRALSPGINDPLTAIHCISYLGAAVVRLAEAGPLSPYSCDESGRVRLINEVPSFERALSSSLGRIRQNAGSSLSVMESLLETLALLLSRACCDEYRILIREEMDAVRETGRANLSSTADRRALERAYQKARSEGHVFSQDATSK